MEHLQRGIAQDFPWKSRARHFVVMSGTLATKPVANLDQTALRVQPSASVDAAKPASISIRRRLR